jgi:heme/copper-type cytochrome/quinol oxidase subunit 3
MEITLTSPPRSQKIVSDGIMGIILLIATEAMFFAGLISAYIVNRSGFTTWPPTGQPRLPVEITAVNTLILISSAVLLWLFKRKFTAGSSQKLLLSAMLGGAVFICVQGSEWARLISFGLTTTSSLYGAFFYLIIGAHALHATAGLLALAWLYSGLRKNISPDEAKNKIIVCSMYWFFVVAIWPVLYTLVYIV